MKLTNYVALYFLSALGAFSSLPKAKAAPKEKGLEDHPKYKKAKGKNKVNGEYIVILRDEVLDEEEPAGSARRLDNGKGNDNTGQRSGGDANENGNGKDPSNKTPPKEKIRERVKSILGAQG